MNGVNKWEDFVKEIKGKMAGYSSNSARKDFCQEVRNKFSEALRINRNLGKLIGISKEDKNGPTIQLEKFVVFDERTLDKLLESTDGKGKSYKSKNILAYYLGYHDYGAYCAGTKYHFPHKFPGVFKAYFINDAEGLQEGFLAISLEGEFRFKTNFSASKLSEGAYYGKFNLMLNENYIQGEIIFENDIRYTLMLYLSHRHNDEDNLQGGFVGFNLKDGPEVKVGLVYLERIKGKDFNTTLNDNEYPPKKYATRKDCENAGISDKVIDYFVQEKSGMEGSFRELKRMGF